MEADRGTAESRVRLLSVPRAWEFHVVAEESPWGSAAAAATLNPWHFHAAFSAWMRASAPEFFAAVHGSRAPSPYSAALLGDVEGIAPRPAQGSHLLLRVGTGAADLAEALTQGLAKHGARLKLDDGIVLRVLPHLSGSEPSSGSPPATLPEKAMSLVIRFATPYLARFAGEIRTYDPSSLGSVLASIARRELVIVGNGTSVFLERLDAKVPRITNLSSARGARKDWQLIGRDVRSALEGTVAYDLSALSPFERRHLFSSFEIAQVLGVGAKTAWGFGQMRVSAE